MSGKYYYVDFSELKIYECILGENSTGDFYIEYYSEDNEEVRIKVNFNKNNLFKNLNEAKGRLKYLKELYIGNFDYRPFIRDDMLIKHYQELMYIQNEIHKRLAGYENFNGIDFCAVGVLGIQIRGHHKKVDGYSYGQHITIKYDFSNVEQCIDEFVEMWKESDTPEKVESMIRFIEQGEKWGWD